MIACVGEVLACGAESVLGEVEAGVAKVSIGFMKAEAAAGGQSKGFGELGVGGWDVGGAVVEGGAGEDARKKIVLMACTAQTADNLLYMSSRPRELGGGIALCSEISEPAKAEMVKGSVQE